VTTHCYLYIEGTKDEEESSPLSIKLKGEGFFTSYDLIIHPLINYYG
jgi:hypothetical protein